MTEGSDNGRVLARLQESPATAAEMYSGLNVMVHSRVSDLRRAGYVINCTRLRGQGRGAASYLYTLKESA